MLRNVHGTLNMRNYVLKRIARTTTTTIRNARCFSSVEAQKQQSLAQGSMNDIKTTLLNAALEKVHTHGWTQDAIVKGALESNLALSFSGMLHEQDLIKYYMQRCNDNLKSVLSTQQQQQETSDNHHRDTPLQAMYQGIKLRLEMNIPYIKSGRWHEAMALGAKPPYSIETTCVQLEELISIIVEHSTTLHQQQEAQTMSKPEQFLLGAVYVATELHMLVDDSEDYVKTWEFLEQRLLRDFAWLQQKGNHHDNNGISIPFDNDTKVAMEAVAKSLGGAIISLAFTSPSLPNMFNTMNSSIMKGSSPQDYESPTTTTTIKKDKQ